MAVCNQKLLVETLNHFTFTFTGYEFAVLWWQITSFSRGFGSEIVTCVWHSNRSVIHAVRAL